MQQWDQPLTHTEAEKGGRMELLAVKLPLRYLLREKRFHFPSQIPYAVNKRQKVDRNATSKCTESAMVL